MRTLLLAAALTLTAACAMTEENDMPDELDVPTVQIQFLEIATPEFDATAAHLSALHGVTFSDPVAALGNARTARLSSGGLLSVRAPMHELEEPTVRPYVLVDDVQAAADAAVAHGAELAMPPTPLPGMGTFAIYFLGGIQHGVWQL